MADLPITADIVPELEAWLDYNRGMGCSPEDLAASLVEAGYRPDDVAAFLAARTSAIPIADASDAIRQFWRRSDALASLNAVWLGDRAGRVLARNPSQGILFLADFLSVDECQSLIAEAEPHLTDAEILDERSGEIATSGGRTSQGAGLKRGGSETVKRVEARIETLTALPVHFGEDLQTLRYEVGGEYRPHVDYFDPDTPGGARMLSRGAQRLATVILYLSDVEAGGGTHFPELSLEFTPARGAALVFPSLDREGRPLLSSLHWGRPVTSGEKWIATKWLRVSPV